MTQLALVILSSGAVNAVYGTIIISLLIGVLLPALRKQGICLNALSSPVFWLLAFFGVTYVFIGAATIQSALYCLITPILAFAAGWAIIDDQNTRRSEKLVQFVFCLIIGYGTHACLNYVTNIGNERWMLVDFYSGSLRAATGSGCINTMIFSLATYILWIEKRALYRLAGAVLFGVSLLYALLLGTRTQFIIMMLVMFITAILLFYERNKAVGLLRVVIAFALIGLVLFILYDNDVAGMRTSLEESNLMARFDPINERSQSKSDGYRIESIVRGLVNVFEHPFGGLIDTSYYHNMWLDIGRVSGFIPFVLMIAYSCTTLFHVIHLYGDKRLSESFRYVLLSVYLGVLINFCTEPILEGLRDFFYHFCIINGMVECYYNKWRHKYACC